MKNFILTAFVFMFSQQIFAQLDPSGNDQGNGGGVICISGKCSTLTDSGLTMSPQFPDFWIPSEDVLIEINRLVDRYPFPKEIREDLLKTILLKMTHFKAVEVVDQQKVNQVLGVYKSTIQAVDPNFDFTNFKIVAISSDDTVKDQDTYLLPDFFNLDSVNQAKILIHEGFYRGKPSKMLKYILQLESALKYFATSVPSITDIRKQAVSAQIAAYNLGILNTAEAFMLILYWTYDENVQKYLSYSYHLGRNFVTRDIFSVELSSGKQWLKIDSLAVQKNAGLEGRTAVMLLNLGDTELTCDKTGDGDDLSFSFARTAGVMLWTYNGNIACSLKDAKGLNLLLPK